MSSFTERELEGIGAMLDEGIRLRALSDRALVFECLSSDMENELVIEEMMTRLYPRWSHENADGSSIEPVPKRIYVAGPITGIEDYNRSAFRVAAKRLTELGYQTITPFDCLITDDWHEGMRAGIRAMLQCEEVFVLPGWERSKGAALEIQIARTLEMPITDVSFSVD